MSILSFYTSSTQFLFFLKKYRQFNNALLQIWFKVEVLFTLNCFVFKTSCTRSLNSVNVAALVFNDTIMTRFTANSHK